MEIIFAPGVLFLINLFIVDLDNCIILVKQAPSTVFDTIDQAASINQLRCLHDWLLN